MPWMMLKPRELDAVKDAVIRAKRLPEDSNMRAFWEKVIAANLKRDELIVSRFLMPAIAQASKDWKSGFHVGFKAILSAADRHIL